MKKMLSIVVSLLLVSAVLFSFTSCHKDGVYTPKKKISRIYTQISGQAKMLTEQWTWKDNLLSKIDYYYNGTYSHTNRYQYDGKQLTEVLIEGGKIRFTYDGSKLEKMEMWYSGSLLWKAEVKHDGKKIIEIEFTEYDVYTVMKSSRSSAYDALKGVLPESSCAHIAELSKKRAAKSAKTGVEVWNLYYTYDGNNIKEERYVVSGEEDKYTYTYDKELNPFFNLLVGGQSYSDYEFSKNNIINVVYTNNYDGDYAEIDFSYVYEKSYPIERTTYYVTGNSFGVTAYYEYE